MTIDIRKYWWQTIGAILAILLFGTQFSEKGIENDKKLGNRDLNNYVEVK